MNVAPFRIILSDDHEIAREGLRLAIERHGAFRIIGEAGSGRELLDLLQRSEQTPDLVVLDLFMDGIEGFHLIQDIRNLHPTTQVVVLTGFDNPDYIERCRSLGASGYIEKGESCIAIAETLYKIVRGESYFPERPSASGGYSQTMHSLEATAKSEILTPREQHILFLIAQGLKNNEISKELNISQRTVEFHRTNLKRKLGMQSTAQLVRHAIEMGIV